MTWVMYLGSEDNCLRQGNQGPRGCFRQGEDLKLSLFANADCADRCNDRGSVSGLAIMLENTAVGASSSTQHCVTLPTSEAEHVVMAHGAKTVLKL